MTTSSVKDEIGNKLLSAVREIRTSLDNAVGRAALLLQAEAQKRCPVDTGALRASAFTRRVGTPDDIAYQVGFSQNYSVYVHEMVNANFKVGQAKFLEEPFLIMAPLLADYIVTILQSGITQGPGQVLQGPLELQGPPPPVPSQEEV
jgi:hypothetical protein